MSIAHKTTDQPKCWFVYIIKTDKDHYYTGITTNLERRFQEHLDRHLGKSKKGAKFFSSQKPLCISYFETFINRSLASKREAEIKKLTRQDKIQLLQLNESQFTIV